MNGAAPPEAQAATKLYRDLHWGRGARKTARVKVPKPRALAEMGRLESVVYSTTKGGDGHSHYEHTFGEEGGKKPSLGVDVDTRDLVIVGGDYTVEPRGIVD